MGPALMGSLFGGIGRLGRVKVEVGTGAGTLMCHQDASAGAATSNEDE